MEIWQLKCFLAVADTMSFSRAAETLYVTQPAISQQISDLEHQLGVELFQRGKKQTSLTNAGKMLYPEAHDLILRHDAIVTTVANEKSNASNLIRIGFEDHLIGYRATRDAIISTLLEMMEEDPGLTPVTFTLDVPGVMSMLQENKLDIIFVTQDFRKKPPSFVSFEIGQPDELYLVYREDEDTRGLSAGEIMMKKGIILPERDPDGIRITCAVMDLLTVRPEVHFCSGQLDMVLAVELGMRTAVLPRNGLFEFNQGRVSVKKLDALPLRINGIYNKKVVTHTLETFIRKLGEKERTEF